MPKSELLSRLRGRRKAKVLVESEWRPSSDFNILSDKIYRHIIRTDGSPLNGLPLLDMRKYLNWWKLRTCGRNIEFCNLPLTLIPEEEEAALCLLLDAAGIKYNIETHNAKKIGVIPNESFGSLLLWNVRLDPYESLKCFNETTQTSDFKEYDDRKISFQSMPRSHLPEVPDVTAQVVLEQWKVDLIDALRRERSYRSSPSSSKSRPPERSTRSSRGSASRSEQSRASNHHTSSSSATRTPPFSAGHGSSGASTPSTTCTETTTAVEPQIAQVVDETSAGTDNSWRNTAWTIGARVLYEALAALGREHTVRTEERQINMRVAAANAQQNRQLWTTVASWGAWSAHTALQYYYGSARNSDHLLRNS